MDIAVLTSPLKPMESIRQYPLVQQEQVVVAGTKYEKYCAKPMEFSALKSLPFILMKKGTSARSYAEKLFAEHHLSCFPKYETGSTPLIISMVEQNLGLGIVPRAFAEDKLKKGTLLEMQIKTPLIPLDIIAITSEIFHTNAVRDKFLAQLRTGTTSPLHLI